MLKINISDWKEFKISDLFDFERPKTRRTSDYQEGSVPYVASGSMNNGISRYCQPQEEEQLEKGNCITVSPIDASSFYQEKDFLGRGGAGSAIFILRNEHLNLKNGLFLSTLIRVCLSSKVAYNDQINNDMLSESKIIMPVDSKGNPDWIYMDKYISNELSKAEKNIQILSDFI